MGMSDNLDNPPPDPPTKSSKSGGGDFDWKELLKLRVGLALVFCVAVILGFFGVFDPYFIDLNVDLTDNLDPQLVPVVVAEAMKEATEAGVSEADFIPSLVSKISNKIRDISTIDLNADDLADPILVMPTSASFDQEFIQFSIKVPDPAEVSELPPRSDQEAWRDIAENKSIEIMTASVTKNAQGEFYIQSAPNPEVYYSAPPYYHYSEPGLDTELLTLMMMRSLFSPPFMGYGGYDGGPPRTVSTVQSQRSSFTASMGSSNPSQSAVTNSKGQSVGQSNFKKTPFKSLKQVKTAQYRSSSSKSSSSTRSSSGSSSSRRR
jgi:hypothetical protein